MDFDPCQRCGQCCYFPGEKGQPVPCRWLEQGQGKKITRCRIYGRREGAVMGKIPGSNLLAICGERSKSFYDFPGCPYNSGKPFPPWVNPPSQLI